MGNSASIKAFSDPWIPRPLTFRPVSFDQDPNLRVADFIDQDRLDSHCWNADKLSNTFLPFYVEVISSIPVSVRGCDDILARHFDKKRIFSVKSGYQVVLNDKIQPSSSNLLDVSKWWNSFWTLNIPSKIKIFAWRASRNALPSMINLFK